MTFSVTGYVDGVAYTCNVDDPNPGTAPYKAASGSPVVLTLLSAHDGLPFPATPLTPAGTLDATDGESIAHALYALTDVRGMYGDPPNLHTPDGPVPAGTVY